MHIFAGRRRLAFWCRTSRRAGPGSDGRPNAGLPSVVGVLLSALVMLPGCALVPQTVDLAPDVESNPSSVGHGVAVRVRVLDQRPIARLGRRSGHWSGDSAAITTNQDVAELVSRQLSTGLRQRGFASVRESAEADVTLVVELRLLKYSAATGILSGRVQANSAVNVKAIRNGDDFLRFYRAQASRQSFVLPATASTNSQLINHAFASVLDKLLGDHQLMAFMAR